MVCFTPRPLYLDTHRTGGWRGGGRGPGLDAAVAKGTIVSPAGNGTTVVQAVMAELWGNLEVTCLSVSCLFVIRPAAWGPTSVGTRTPSVVPRACLCIYLCMFPHIAYRLLKRRKPISPVNIQCAEVIVCTLTVHVECTSEAAAVSMTHVCLSVCLFVRIQLFSTWIHQSV